MAEVTIQGVLSVGSNDLYVVGPSTTARVKYLKFYNPVQDGWMHVEDIPENGTFELKNGKRFN